MTHAVMSSATALMISLSRKNITRPRSPSRRLSHLRLRLLQPEPHVHLAIHCRRGAEVFACLLALASTAVAHFPLSRSSSYGADVAMLVMSPMAGSATRGPYAPMPACSHSGAYRTFS